MMNEKPSFVFFGSGPVAAESLRQISEFFSVEAVITKPTTEHEMRAACPSAPLYCVQSKNELDTLLDEQNFTSTVGVLIDFGIIVSNQAISSFERGIVNSHFSLLPQWRGADPITFSILSGQKVTGVSLMLLVEKMDEGPLLDQAEVLIEDDETTVSLTEKLINTSSGLLQAILPEWITDSVVAGEQLAVSICDDLTPSYSRKLTKADGQIDWQKSALQIEREIRAFIEWPKSYTKLGNIECVITKAHSSEPMVGEIGTISVQNKELHVVCGEGSLSIDELKPAGKKNMDIRSFLAGYQQKLASK
jgi:methionyl-tRNA formyltransferase